MARDSERKRLLYRVAKADFEKIMAIGHVIAVAGGAEKASVILAALRGRLVDVLVTDSRTASQLLGAGSADHA